MIDPAEDPLCQRACGLFIMLASLGKAGVSCSAIHDFLFAGITLSRLLGR